MTEKKLRTRDPNESGNLVYSGLNELASWKSKVFWLENKVSKSMLSGIEQFQVMRNSRVAIRVDG